MQRKRTHTSAGDVIGDIFNTNKQPAFEVPKRTKMKGAVEPARPIKKKTRSKIPKE